MCGRFTLTIDPGELQDAFQGFDLASVEYNPRYNIAPTQPVLVIPNTVDKKFDYYSWGLVPSWAKDPSIGSRMINARAETLAEKPSFRTALRRRRCLIPTDGFYEWKMDPVTKAKSPLYIYLKDHKPFAFAGLWEIWFSADGSEIRSCTIITTEANAAIQPFHDRMPVIIDPSDYSNWLDVNEKDPASLGHLLKPYPADQIIYHNVSKAVNSPAVDRVECIEPVG